MPRGRKPNPQSAVKKTIKILTARKRANSKKIASLKKKAAKWDAMANTMATKLRNLVAHREAELEHIANIGRINDDIDQKLVVAAMGG